MPRNTPTTDVLGETLTEYRHDFGKQELFVIDLASYASGTYFLKIETEENTEIRKVVIRK